MSLRVVVGPMFAGKTSEIQSVVRRFTCLGKRVLVLTASIDTRYSSGPAVTTHDLTTVPAVAVSIDGDDLVSMCDTVAFKEAAAVVVDEAQFFRSGLVPFVLRAVEEFGKHVVVVGLDGDAARAPFGDVLSLVPLADSVEKRTALCIRCGDGTPALFTRERVHHAEQIAVGGSESYEPVCRKHFHHTE